MAEGANIESLSLEISVNTKDAAQSVRLLKGALDGLERTLRHIDNLHVSSLFAGISESGKQAAAEVKYNAEQIKKELDGLIAASGMKGKLDTEFAMRETFDSFERQIANLDSKMAASDWQEQMANGFRLMQSAGTDAAQSFNTIHDAADQSYTLADAMRMVRGAMGSVSSGTTTPLNTIKDAAEQAGEQVRDLHKEFMGLARPGASGIKSISFDKDKLDQEAAAIRERNAAIREASLERPNGMKDLTANADMLSTWANEAFKSSLLGKSAPTGASLVEWLRKSSGGVEAEGERIGRIAAEAIKNGLLAEQASAANSFELFGNTSTVHISPAYEEGLRQAWRQLVLRAKAEVDTEEGGGDTRVFQSMGDGISESFGRAIEQTRTFQQVSGTLTTITQTLSPALQAAGVNVEAFGAAMTAAAGPISIVIIAIQAAVKVVTFLVDQFEEFVDVCKKFIKVARDLNERFNPFESIKKELASILALAKRQILRRAINAVIKAVTEGLKEGVANLAEYDAEFGATIQSLKNSMGLFKNSIGVAVAPIISYFIPALNTLLAMLTRAMNMFARLTALLTGKHTYTIAKDYQEVGDSAGGAAGKVKELQRTILGFDEINRLNGNNGSGGGGGGGAGDAISAYETMDVGEWPYDSWGEALLAFTEWVDKTGVPALRTALGKVSSFVNKFSKGLYDALTYNGLQESIANLATDLGQTINNFLNGGEANGGLDWAAIGRAIGMGIQTAINFAAHFLLQLDFLSLGQNLATMLNEAVKQIKPEELADVLFTPIRAAFGLVVGFLLEFDLSAFASKVGQFVNRLVQNIADMISNVKDWNKVWDNIANGIISFIDSVDWDNLFNTLDTIVNGLFNGLNRVMDKLAKDGRLKQIIHRFIDIAVRIATEWLKLKMRVIMDALEGFSLGGVLMGKPYGGGTAIGGMGIGTFGIQDVFRQLFDTLDSGVDSVEETDGAISSLKGTTERTASAVSASGKIIGSSLTGVGTAAKNANTTVGTATQGMSTHFSNLNVNASKPMRELANTASTQFASIKNSGNNNMRALASAANTQFTAIKNSATNGMSAAKTNAVNNAEALRKDVANKFASAASSANTEFGKAQNAIVNNIAGAKSRIPGFGDVGANLKNGLINGMYGFEGKLDAWANQFKGRILKNFRIKSPSRWAKEEVGSYLSEGIALGMTDSSAVEQACAGLKEGIASEFDTMSFFGGVRASTSSAANTDIASAIGNQVMAGIASMDTSGTQQPIVCEVYLDRDRIATAVTRGQQQQNRRYSSTALA